MKETSTPFHTSPLTSRFSAVIPSGVSGVILMLMLFLPLFFSCRPLHYSERRAQLDSLQRANQADTVFRSDSLQRILVDYFDRHGTADDRMLAHYLLGRAYYDMGETPLALHHYHEAIESADTTDKDCDFRQLGRIHGQTAWLLLDQGSPSDALYELRDAVHYAKSSGDTLMCIACIEETGSVYGYLGLKDSAVTYRQIASSMYEKAGYEAKSAIALGPIIDILIEQGKLSDARLAMNRYETQSRIFNSHGDIEEGREMYYNAKGLYYLAIHQVDSAGLYFSKLKRTATYIDQLKCACSGLSRVFELKGNKDSALYYCQLANAYNDSSSNLKMTEGYQQAQARYRYSRHQQMAEKREHELERSRLLLLVFVLSAAVILLFAIRLVQVYRRRVHQTRMELLSVSEAHERDLSDLKSLKIEISDLQSEQQALMDEKEQLKQVNACILDEMNDLKSEKDNAAEISLRLSRQISVGRNLIARKQREITACKREIEEKTELVELLSNRVKEYENNQPALISGPARASLLETAIYKHILELAHHPRQKVKASDWHELEREMEAQIPSLGPSLKTKFRLNDENYRLCLLVILKLSPGEIATLLGLDHDIVAKKRKRLCKKIFNIEASPGDFDMRLRQIF